MQTDQTTPQPPLSSLAPPERGRQSATDAATGRPGALQERLRKAERELRAFIADRPLVASALAALAGAATAQLALVALRRRHADVEQLVQTRAPLLAALAAWPPRKSTSDGLSADRRVTATSDSHGSPTLEQAQSAAHRIGGRVRSALARAADSTSSRVEGPLRQAAGQARQNYGEAVDLVESAAVTHPIATLAIAAGVGSLLVGLLCTRR